MPVVGIWVAWKRVGVVVAEPLSNPVARTPQHLVAVSRRPHFPAARPSAASVKAISARGLVTGANRARENVLIARAARLDEKFHSEGLRESQSGEIATRAGGTVAI